MIGTTESWRRAKGGTLLLLFAACLPVLATGCAGSGPAEGRAAAKSHQGTEPEAPAEVDLEDGEARAGDAVAGPGSGRARAGDGKPEVGRDAGRERRRESVPERLSLKVGGAPGTRFSGECAAGGGERAIEGRVPERYTFAPAGVGLECEIRKESGVLEVVVAGPGFRSVQRAGTGESTIKFALSKGTVSSAIRTPAPPDGHPRK